MGKPDSSDADWVRAAVERFERPLLAYASRLLGDPESARDVVQDAFLKLCGQPRGAVESHLAEWLFTVCRNRSLDVLRKEGRMSQLGEDDAHTRSTIEPGPAEVVERKDSAAKALRLLDALPKGQREVIRLRVQNDFSYREISRISGFSEGNVGYLIHMGLKTLRGQLAEGEPAAAQL